MEEKNIAEKTFEKIEEEKIKPKSRRYFIFKNYLFWFLVAISFVIGAIAFNAMLFVLVNHDWLVYQYLNKGLLEFILISIPYFWFLVLIIFLASAYSLFRSTKGGYRCGTCLAAGLGIFMIIILGIIFFWLGLKSEINEQFLKKTGLLQYDKYDIWNNPAKGLLGGDIVNFKNKNDFEIADFNGRAWRINGKNAETACCFILGTGVKIKIIGKIDNTITVESGQLENIFIAKQISPWGL